MKKIKNLHVPVNGVVMTDAGMMFKPLDVIVTNDGSGKTISINDGKIQFVIPFEPIEQYLR